MFRQKGPEKIDVEENSKPSNSNLIEEVNFKSADDVFSPQQKTGEMLRRDAKEIAQTIDRVLNLEQNNVKAQEKNEINQLRAQLQDTISGHLVTFLINSENSSLDGVMDSYANALHDSLENNSQAESAKSFLRNRTEFIQGIKSHAYSVMRARSRRIHEVKGSDLDPFSTMRIGSSEFLDTQYKTDYCNLRWMPDHPSNANPLLRLDLVQAKTAFPVANGSDQMAHVNEIKQKQIEAAKKFLNPPKLYENFDDIRNGLGQIIDSALLDITGSQLKDYKDHPAAALFESIIAKNFRAVFEGRAESLTVNNINDINSEENKSAKSDLRSMMVLQKELQSDPEVVEGKLKALINECTEQFRLPENIGMTEDEIQQLIHTACSQLAMDLKKDDIFTEQPLEVYSVIDASDARIIIEKGDKGNRKKREVNYWQQRLTDEIDKNIFGVYFIQTEDLIKQVQNYDIFS